MSTRFSFSNLTRWLRAVALPLALVLALLGSFTANAHEQQKGGTPWSGSGHVGDPLLPENGQILEFSAENVALLSWLSPEDITGVTQTANDVWGYVSPSGREYAILGLRLGTAFVEVTDPLNPKVLKTIPGSGSTWRDMAVYDEYAYSVTEGGGGIQVIDLRRIDKGKVKIANRVQDLGLDTVHNITVDPDSGYAYLSGSNLAEGGLVAVDLSDPANPVVEPGVWAEAYVHDVVTVTYTKGKHAGREIVYAFAGEDGIAIIDVTDKRNMFTVDLLTYPGLSYSHSGAVDRKLKYLYANDELDELDGAVGTSTTYLFKIKDFENARFVKSFTSERPTIDHNGFVRGNWLYQANYESGLRVYQIKRPKNPRQQAFLDTYPEADSAHFNGAWGVFAGYPSGIVVISDIQRGLFVLLPPS
ncbi:MAG: choice-of-anchor B family protein [Acidimicrobiia bacterium]|nr:choice-of-anchor B family protein [Acidimicrobiia bacterium]